jgi:hypothetical protein
MHSALAPALQAEDRAACRYLGAKLQYGHIPLYISGQSVDAKRFGSLHAVQRHMVDSNRCSMLYDGNEDEYEDYYEYPCASLRNIFGLLSAACCCWLHCGPTVFTCACGSMRSCLWHATCTLGTLWLQPKVQNV